MRSPPSREAPTSPSAAGRGVVTKDSFQRALLRSLRGIRRALEAQVELETRRVRELAEFEVHSAAQSAELVEVVKSTRDQSPSVFLKAALDLVKRDRRLLRRQHFDAQSSDRRMNVVARRSLDADLAAIDALTVEDVLREAREEALAAEK